ncbi:C6 finger domain-containing protein, variant [Homalodisca vitripennis]|nr:C6 finger domain-containing protein, variant [Homalodisca vitripennis]
MRVHCDCREGHAVNTHFSAGTGRNTSMALPWMEVGNVLVISSCILTCLLVAPQHLRHSEPRYSLVTTQLLWFEQFYWLVSPQYLRLIVGAFSFVSFCNKALQVASREPVVYLLPHLNDDEIREFFLDSDSEDEELDSSDVGLPTAESDVSMELEDDSSDNSSDSEEEDYFIGPQNLFEWLNASDSLSGPPENVTVICRYDNITRSSVVFVTWTPPSQPNGKIVYYNVVLQGSARFRNEKGVEDHVTWGPKAKNINEILHSARFDMVPPNTNYSVKVAGVTRIRGGGLEAVQHCHMPPTTPDREKLRSINWGKVEEHGRWLLKLFMPRVSERNGRICCFRVFVTKLEQHQSVADLPPPQDSHIYSYQEVHYNKRGGTYLADMFESDALSSDIFLGDGHTIVSPTNHSACQQCVGLRPRPPTVASPLPPTTAPPAPAAPTTPEQPTTAPVLADIPSLYSASLRERRSPTTATPLPDYDTQLYDGQLDTNSNYTGFVEVIVGRHDEQAVMLVGTMLEEVYCSKFLGIYY